MVAIPVEDFKQHCIDYHKSRDAGFEEEYESLAVGPLAVHEVSQMLCNKQKNRFANIYPYDDSRVVLEEIPGFLGSDYINASWINGYKHPNAYIASQGPKMSTVGDFWRMVWQYKVDHIVMVTGLCEGGRIKCERYWSEEVGGTVEVEEANLKATTTSITTHRDFVIRTMTLNKITECPDFPPPSFHSYGESRKLTTRTVVFLFWCTAVQGWGELAPLSSWTPCWSESRNKTASTCTSSLLVSAREEYSWSRLWRSMCLSTMHCVRSSSVETQRSQPPD
jgi:hypothetical protein